MKQISSIEELVIGEYYLCYQPATDYEWMHIAYHKYEKSVSKNGYGNTSLIMAYMIKGDDRKDGVEKYTGTGFDHPDKYFTDNDHINSIIFELTEDEVLTNIIAESI